MSAIDKIPEGHFVGHRSDHFKPKLDHAKRCAVLALTKSKIKRERVAAAFGVDRRTVSHISNDTSPHYKAIRRHYVELGHDAFVKKYLTEEVAALMAAVPITGSTTTSAKASSRRSNAYEGEHLIPAVDGLRAKEHHVVIEYREGYDGWAFRDLDGDAPDEFYHNGDASLKSSKACYEAILENLTD